MHLLLPPVPALRTVVGGGVVVVVVAVVGGDGIRPHLLPGRCCCCSHRESVAPAEDGTEERLPTDVGSDGNVSDAAVAAAAGYIGDAAAAAVAGNVVLCSAAADGSVVDDNAPVADDVGSAFRQQGLVEDGGCSAAAVVAVAVAAVGAVPYHRYRVLLVLPPDSGPSDCPRSLGGAGGGGDDCGGPPPLSGAFWALGHHRTTTKKTRVRVVRVRRSKPAHR